MSELLSPDRFDIIPHAFALLVAYLLALPIGWNREKAERSAGLRTFPLVAVACCGFVQAAESLTADSPEAMARIIMNDRYVIPRRLDDPELIGFWTLDEFAGMIIPFTWGILAQHIFIGIGLSFGAWFALRKAKAGRASSWVLHAAYWYLPAGFTGLRMTPPSHCRLLAG